MEKDKKGKFETRKESRLELLLVQMEGILDWHTCFERSLGQNKLIHLVLVAVASIRKPSVEWLVMAFIIFRIFDVLKPWPCRRLEKIGGGKGILYDDLMAGLYTFIILMVSRELTGWPQ